MSCRQLVAVDDYSFGAGGSTSTTESTTGTGGEAPQPCVPGESVACYDGPSGTENLGTCKAGMKTCTEDGTGFGACSGQVLPATLDDCGAMIDSNCDGAAPTACSGEVGWVRHYAPFETIGALQLGGLEHAGGNLVISIDSNAPVLWNGQLTPPFVFEGQRVTLNGALDADGNLVWGGSSFGPHRRGFGASSSGLFASLPIANQHSFEKVDAVSGDTLFWATKAQPSLSAGGSAAVAAGKDWALELRSAGASTISALRIDPLLKSSELLSLTSAATMELGDAEMRHTAAGDRLFIAGCYAGSVSALNGPCALLPATNPGLYDVFLVEVDPAMVGPEVNGSATLVCAGEPRRVEALAYGGFCDARIATNDAGRLCLAAYSRGPEAYRIRATCFDPGETEPVFDVTMDSDPLLGVADDYQHVDVTVDPLGYPTIVVSHGEGFLGLDGVPLTSEGAVGATVIKLHKTSGATLWKQSISSTFPHRLYISSDEAGRVYVAASLQGASRIGNEAFGAAAIVEAAVASFAP